MLSDRIGNVVLHPAILAIAIELILHPDRSSRYPDKVLILAEEAISEINKRVAERALLEQL